VNDKKKRLLELKKKLLEMKEKQIDSDKKMEYLKRLAEKRLKEKEREK
jgi:hypothetical protein